MNVNLFFLFKWSSLLDPEQFGTMINRGLVISEFAGPRLCLQKHCVNWKRFTRLRLFEETLAAVFLRYYASKCHNCRL